MHMAKETWIEVRVVVPARMQEEASLFLTDFSGRGVIIEEENDDQAGCYHPVQVAATADHRGGCGRKGAGSGPKRRIVRACGRKGHP
jgi:hypothetical protein